MEKHATRSLASKSPTGNKETMCTTPMSKREALAEQERLIGAGARVPFLCLDALEHGG